jgi:hypothetical protein
MGGCVFAGAIRQSRVQLRRLKMQPAESPADLPGRPESFDSFDRSETTPSKRRLLAEKYSNLAAPQKFNRDRPIKGAAALSEEYPLCLEHLLPPSIRNQLFESEFCPGNLACAHEDLWSSVEDIFICQQAK